MFLSRESSLEKTRRGYVAGKKAATYPLDGERYPIALRYPQVFHRKYPLTWAYPSIRVPFIEKARESLS